MIVPLKESLIYAEPIYLQAEKSQMPELKRVIFAYKDNIVMHSNLNNAITTMFSNQDIEVAENIMDDKNSEAKTLSIKGILDKLVKDYKEFKQSAKSNDWESFGKNLSKMDHWIKKIQENKNTLN